MGRFEKLCVEPVRVHGSLEDAYAHARILGAGAVSGGVVHDVANLLTVLDGMRQMAALEGSKGCDASLIEGPAGRCQQLVEAFRRVFADPSPRPEPVCMDAELEALETLVSARLRGRRTRLERSPMEPRLTLAGTGAAPLRLATLLAVLALLEHGRQHEQYPHRLRFEARGEDDRCACLRVTLEGFCSADDEHPASRSAELLWSVAGNLLHTSGGRLAARFEPDRTARVEAVPGVSAGAG